MFFYGRQFRLRMNKDGSFLSSVLALIGHLLAAGCIFVAYFVIIWLISCFLTWLNSVHPFPKEIFDFITKGEVWFMYVDWVLCIVVLGFGVVRFLGELGREHL